MSELAFSLINSFLIQCYLKQFLWHIKHCMDTDFFMLNFAEIHEACSLLFLVLFLQMVLWNTRAAVPHFLHSCRHALHPPHFQMAGVGHWMARTRIQLCASPLLVLQHRRLCSVGKVAFEVTFSLWRLLKGRLREVSCLFWWEVCSSGGERPWRCRQQRLPATLRGKGSCSCGGD